MIKNFLKKNWAIVTPLCITIIFFCSLLNINQYVSFSIILALLIFNILYAILNFYKRFCFLLFNLTFFTFLMGEPFINMLEGKILMPGFTSEITTHIILCLFLSLLSLFFGLFLFEKYDRSPSKLEEDKIEKFVIRKSMKIAFYISAIPYFYIIIEKIIFVSQNSYKAYYTDFSSSLPYLITKISTFFIIFFILFLATYPSKKEARPIVFVFLLSGLLSLGYGQRNILVLDILLVAMYYVLRNNHQKIKHQWINKKILIICAICLPLMIYFLYSMQSYRYGLDSNATGLMDGVFKFFKSQGTVYEVIGYEKFYDSMIPSGQSYTFGPLINSFNNNTIIHNIFNTKIYEPYTVDMALHGNVLGHTLIYLHNQTLYLSGGTMGTSYIAEVFHDFSYFGIVIINIIYGGLLGYLFKKRTNIYSFSISFLMLKELIYSPRGTAISFISNIFTISNLFALIGIFVIYYMFSKSKLYSILEDRCSKRLLLLATTLYPYKNSETFIESEEPFYNVFDKKYIYACNAKYDDSCRSSKCHLIKPTENRIVKAYALLKTILSISLYTEILSIMIQKSFTFNRCKQALSVLYFSKLYTINIRVKLNVELSLSDKITFYSYWLDAKALSMIELSQYYDNSIAISRAHRIDLYDYATKNKYQVYRKRLAKYLDRIFFISQDGLDYFKNHYFDYNNLELSRLGTRDVATASRISHKINKQLIIVSCSGLSPVKRIHLIIEALEKVNDIPIIWYHLGDGILKNTLMQQAEKLGQNIKVEFLGNKSNEEVLKFYSENDLSVFINVSDSEGLPVSIMEAISFGLPIIATNVGGTNEIVKNEYNGYLLHKDFKETELIQAIYQLMQLTDIEYQNYCSNSRKLWEKDFNSSVNYSQFIDRIIELMEHI